MNNELQNDEYYLRGDFGMVKIGSASYGITKTFKANNGTITMTITPFPAMLHIEMPEDIIHEEVKSITIKQH